MAVYFIQAGENGPVKIGFASAMDKRFNCLQVGHYEKLHLIRSIAGTELHERWLHHHFRERLIRGEWFSYCDEMLTVEPPADLTDEFDPEKFRNEVKAFLAERNMAPSMFGMKAIGYGEGILLFLERRRNFRIRTIERIRAYMAQDRAA